MITIHVAIGIWSFLNGERNTYAPPGVNSPLRLPGKLQYSSKGFEIFMRRFTVGADTLGWHRRSGVVISTDLNT
jgi:hypothetical protein